MASTETVEFSMILPAYNEQDGVKCAIEAHVEQLTRCCSSFELIVIDDGSRDDTYRNANEAALRSPHVRLLRNESNLGQVATILRGFREARGLILMHNGVDLPFDPAGTERVLERFQQGADVVVIERSDRSAYGRTRKLISWVNVTLVRLLLKSPVSDHNFTQAYRRHVVDAIEVETTGVSTVTTELIVKAAQLGYRVDSLRLDYFPRQTGNSSIDARRTVHSIVQLFRLWRVLRGARWNETAEKPNPTPPEVACRGDE